MTPALAADATGTNRRNVKRILSSSGLSVAIGAPLSLLTVPLFLHRLDVTAYGAYATIASLLAIAGLAEAGIATEVVRRVARAHAGRDPLAMRTIVREGCTVLLVPAGVVLAIGLLGAFTLQHLIFGTLPTSLARPLSGVTVVVSAAFAIDLVVSGWTATLTGLQRSDVDTYAGIAGTLIGTTITVALILGGVGIWSLGVGAVAQTAISAGIRGLGMRRLAPEVTFGFAPASLRQARAYSTTSGIVLISSMSNIIDFQFDKILLANLVGAAAAGTYAVGSSLALQARGLSLLPVGLLLPGTVELGEGPRLDRLRRSVGQLNTAAALVLTGGVVLFAPAFIRLWVGAQYESAAFTAQVLAIALLFNGLTGPMYTHCVAVGLLRIPLYSALTNIVANASVSWVLIAAIGFRGAAIGSTVGNLLGAALLAVLLTRASPGPWLQGLAAPGLVVGLLTLVLLPLTAARHFHWWSLGLTGGGWTLGCLLLFVLAGWLPLTLRGGRPRLA